MFDPDLTDLLASCSNDELDPLVSYLSKPWTSRLRRQPGCREHYPDHRRYVSEIVDELQRFGGNTFANLVRRRGVPYARVVRDACAKVGAERRPDQKVEDREIALLLKVLGRGLDRASPDERLQFQEQLRAASGIRNLDLSAAVPLGLLFAQLGARASGFLAYQIATIVANAVARVVLQRGLSLAANAALARALAIATGPIGWSVTGLWTVFDLAGPAYRVTVACCCHVAYLRQARKYRQLVEELGPGPELPEEA
jgi:uncharacterized protein YaaW (UPF0174 family)